MDERTEIDGFISEKICCSNDFLWTWTSPDERPSRVWPALRARRVDGPSVAGGVESGVGHISFDLACN